MKSFFLIISAVAGLIFPSLLSAHSQDYLTLESISYETDSRGLLNGIFTLTDGSKWSWIMDPEYIDYVDQWQAGDQVCLTRNFGNYLPLMIGLLNYNHHYSATNLVPITVKLTPESCEFYPRVVEIDMTKDYLIVLSNGTRWTVGWGNSFYAQYWKVGDYVLIGSKGIALHSLINLSMPSAYYSSTINALLIEE